MKILSAIRKLLIRDAVADVSAGYTEYFKNDPDSASRVYSEMDDIFTVLTYGEVLNRASAQTGLADFSREGYAFKEWNTQPDGGGTSYHGGEAISNGTVLYAIWIEKTDVVALNHEGAKILYDDLRGHIDEKVDLPGVYDYKSAVPADVVEIYDAVPEKIKQMQIEIAPVQDLHGYDKPWVGGAGKNLIEPKMETSSANGVTCTNNNDGSFTLTTAGGSSTSVTTFRIDQSTRVGTDNLKNYSSGDYTVSGLSNSIRLTVMKNEGSAPVLEFTGNETLNVASDQTGCFMYLRIAAGVTLDNVTIKPMLEKGSTASEWEPYSNICPISGFTGCEVTREGENLFDESTASIYRMTLIGGTYASSDNSRTYAFPCKSLTKYKITVTNSDITVFRVASVPTEPNISNPSPNNFNNFTSKGSVTISTTSEDKYILVQVNQAIADARNAGVEIIYAETYSITFPDGQTVYGGTLTVNADGTGTLVVDRGYSVITATESGVLFDANNRLYIPSTFFPGVKGVDTNDSIANAKTNMMQIVSVNGTYAHTGIGFAFGKTGNGFAYSPSINSKEEWQAYLASTNLQVVYEFATPTSIPLTAPQIRTILGYNRIYANTGSILSMLYPAEKYQTAEQAEKERIHAVVDESSAVATITDGADNVPMGMQIAIAPVQDLHGYDYPWPGGAMGNLAKLSDTIVGSNQKSTVTYSDSGATITATGTYARYGWLIPVTIGETYIISFLGKASSDESGMNPKAYFGSADGAWSSSEAGYLTNVGIPTTASMRSFSFTASSNVLFFGIYVTSTATSGNIEISNVQLELGSTASDYVPYSNICPITGWTGAEISRTGKNLLFKKLAGENITSAGKIESGSGYDCYAAQVVSGEKYIVSGNSDTPTGYVIAFYTSEPVLGSTSYNGSRIVETTTKVFTAPTNGFVVVRSYSSDTAVQIEHGETASTYEAYQGNTYHITFPSSAGTVYGGTLTVNKDGTGSLIVDKFYKSLTGNDFVESSAYSSFSTSAYSEIKGIGLDSTLLPYYISNMFLPTVNEELSSKDNFFGIGSSKKIIAKSTSNFTTLAEAKLFFDANPLQIVGLLETPITYTLSAPVIRSLLGANNVWADTGNVLHLDYTADTKSYIDNLFASLTNATGQTF